MYRSLISLALVLSPLALVACGTTDAAPAPAAPQKQSYSDAELQQLCIEVFTKNRACTDTYIPALVDLRAKYDQPAGIAAEVKADRDRVIELAKGEWATDSTDDAIAATCTNIGAKLTDGDRADADKARACLQETECGAWTTCSLPLFEKRFTK